MQETRSHSVQQISDLPGFYELTVKSGSVGMITKDRAMRLSAVFACVNAIACDLAGLPIHVVQKTKNGVERLKDHPVSDLIRLNPNPEMRAFDWQKIRRVHTLLSGNSITLIERSRLSPVKHLWALDPDDVSLERVINSDGSRGRLRYKVNDGIGRTKYYEPEDILHLKSFSWNGLWGDSVITHYARQQIGIGIELDDFERTFLSKGMHPGGLFKHPGVLKEPNRTNFIEALKKKFGGSKNAGTPMVLEQGMDYVPYNVKMVDQQFMELLKLNKSDICGIFGVPQSRIGISDSNTNYNNTEQEKRRYYESGLLPYAIPDEQEMTFRLLTAKERQAGIYIKYNFDGFLRGDSKTRAEVSRIWSQMGVPVNDLLSIDDRNPVDGGDVGLVQLNMTPIKQIGEIQAIKAGKSIDNQLKTPKTEEIEPKEQKTDENRVKGSILQPILTDIMAQIVNRENIAVSKLIKRENADIESFYADFDEFIIRKLTPFAESYSQLMSNRDALNVEKFAENYIKRSKIELKEQKQEKISDILTKWRENRANSEIIELLGGF